MNTANDSFVTGLLAEREKQNMILVGIDTLLERYGHGKPKSEQEQQAEPPNPLAKRGGGPKGPRLLTVLTIVLRDAGKPLTPEEAQAELVKTNPKWTLAKVKDALKANSDNSDGKTAKFKSTEDGRFELIQSKLEKPPMQNESGLTT